MSYGRFCKKGLVYGLAGLMAGTPFMASGQTARFRIAGGDSSAASDTLRVVDFVDSTDVQILRGHVSDEKLSREVVYGHINSKVAMGSYAAEIDTTKGVIKVRLTSKSQNPYGLRASIIGSTERGTSLLRLLGEWDVIDSKMLLSDERIQEMGEIVLDYLKRRVKDGERVDISKIMLYETGGRIIDIRYTGDKKGLEHVLDENGNILIYNIDNNGGDEEAYVGIPIGIIKRELSAIIKFAGRPYAADALEHLLGTLVVGKRDTVVVRERPAMGGYSGRGINAGDNGKNKKPLGKGKKLLLAGAALTAGAIAIYLKSRSKGNDNPQPPVNPPVAPSGGEEGRGGVK